jgi:hypothetical protein
MYGKRLTSPYIHCCLVGLSVLLSVVDAASWREVRMRQCVVHDCESVIPAAAWDGAMLPMQRYLPEQKDVQQIKVDR